MLAGLRVPEEGTVRFLPPEETGYLPERYALHAAQPVRRSLEYFGRLRGLTRSAARERAMQWLTRLQLEERGRERYRDLPAAAQRRVAIAAALLHAPKTVLLDEGFTDLDPATHDLLREEVRAMRAGGGAVLLTSSDLHADERLVDGVVLMNRGRAILQGGVTELRGKLYASGAPRLHDLFVEALRRDDAAARP